MKTTSIINITKKLFTLIMIGWIDFFPHVFANPPYIPVNLTCTFNKNNQEVTLTWKQPLTVPVGYLIYRDHVLLDSMMNDGSDLYTYTTKLTEYGIFAFHVRAYNRDGESNVMIHRSVTWLDPDEYSSSLQQWGITWLFDTEVNFGQFANGDLWVIGPVNIVGINPVCDTSGGITIHGAMINPYIREGNVKQGYDSRQRNYHDSLNVALNISVQTPLIINPGNSLVSVRSYYPEESTRILRTAAVLTILDEPPLEGSFRPSFAAKSKVILHNKSELNCNFLQNLSIPDDAETMADVVCQIEKVFLDHSGSDFMMEAKISPVENMEHYGRDVSAIIEKVAIHLNLDYTLEEKEKLIINFVQMGLDLYGVIQSSPNPRWNAWGGHFLGRKLPVLFAGVVLNDTNIQNVEKHYPELYFAENDIVYYYNDPRLPEDIYNKYSWTGSKVLYKFNYYWDDPKYKQIYEHKHPSEWSLYDTATPYISDNTAESYRICCTAKYLAGIALGARLMGLKELWNNDAFFDYIDRWVFEDMTCFLPILNSETNSTRDVRDYAIIGNTFVRDIWNKYRNYSDTIPPTKPENVTCMNPINGTKKIIWDPCGDNLGGVRYYIYYEGNIVDTVFATYEWIVHNDMDIFKCEVAAADWTDNITPKVGCTMVGMKNIFFPVLKTLKVTLDFPNPFNPDAKIKYNIPKSTNDANIHVVLKIYDRLGKEIATLVNDEKPAGSYEVKLNTSSLSEGIYFCCLSTNISFVSKKMILIK